MPNNVISKIAIILIFITQSTAVLAMDRNIYFIGGSLGGIVADIEGNSENGMLTEVVVGQYYNETDVSLEVAYTELDEYDFAVPAGTNTEAINYDMSGAKFIAAKHFIFTPNMYMNVKGGLVYWQENKKTVTKNQSNAIVNSTSEENNGTNVYLGLGYSYSLTKESRVNFVVERFETDHADFTNALVGIIFSM